MAPTPLGHPGAPAEQPPGAPHDRASAGGGGDAAHAGGYAEDAATAVSGEDVAPGSCPHGGGRAVKFNGGAPVEVCEDCRTIVGAAAGGAR